MELIPDVFFCLQVDGPITGGGGLVSGWAYKWQLTVLMYLSVSLETVKPCQNLACYKGFEKEIIIRSLCNGLQKLVKTGVRM